MTHSFKQTITAAFICFALTLILLACKKENAANIEQVQDIATHVHFDETNSSKITWDQLPEDLRNAVPIKDNPPVRNSERITYSSIGPWGGNGGNAFLITPPSNSKIHSIAIHSGSLVDRFTVWYEESNGTISMGGDRGGNGGNFYFQHFLPNEYIKAIGGRSGRYLDRLTITTNKKSFSYGGNGGTSFSATIPSGYQVLGFFGRSGGYIDQIGFNVYSR